MLLSNILRCIEALLLWVHYLISIWNVFVNRILSNLLKIYIEGRVEILTLVHKLLTSSLGSIFHNCIRQFICRNSLSIGDFIEFVHGIERLFLLSFWKIQFDGLFFLLILDDALQIAVDVRHQFSSERGVVAYCYRIGFALHSSQMVVVTHVCFMHGTSFSSPIFSSHDLGE